MNIFSEHFDKVATEYDFIATLHNNNDFFTTNLSRSKGSALDIGCGSGVLTYELSKYYNEVIGIDISEKMLVITNKKRSSQNIKYIYMDATKLKLNKKFDVITTRTVFHHFKDISAVINKLKPLLNEQGKLIILGVTSEKGTPNTVGYIIGAVKNFVPDCQKYGLNNAIRFFRFKTSRHWIKARNIR